MPINTSSNGPSDRLLTREFLLLGLATIIFFWSDGISLSLLPVFVVDELGGSETMAGFVMGSVAISAFLCRPWLGRLGDSRGAKLLLVIGGIASALGFLVLWAANDLDLAFASRLLIGLGRAGVLVGASLLALQIAPDGRKAEAASYILVAVHIGQGMGPIAGEAIRNNFSYDMAWLTIVVFSLVGTAVAMLLPTRVNEHHTGPTPLIHRAAIGPGLVSFLGIFALNGFLVFAPLYGREIGLNDVGLVFTVVSFTMVFMRVAFGRLPDQFGPVRTSSCALIVTVIGAVVVAFWATPAGMYVGAAILALGLSFQSPSLMSITVGRISDRERGAAMATFTAFFDVANALAGPFFGLIIAAAGYQYAFLSGGLAALIALAILLLSVAPQERSANA